MTRKENGGKSRSWEFFGCRVSGERVEKFRRVVEYLERTEMIPKGNRTEFFNFLLDKAWIGVQNALEDEELVLAARRVEESKADFDRLVAARQAMSMAAQLTTQTGDSGGVK